MTKEQKIKLTDLLVNPRSFFEHLYKDNDYKKHIRFLLFVSVVFVVIWFARILYVISSPNHFLVEDVAVYSELFQVRDMMAFGVFLLFLLVDILVFFVFSVAIAFIAKLVGYIFKIKLDFRYYWKITCYISWLAVPLMMIKFLLDVLLLSEVYSFVGTSVNIYGLILLIFGVKVFSEQSKQNRIIKRV